MRKICMYNEKHWLVQSENKNLHLVNEESHYTIDLDTYLKLKEQYGSKIVPVGCLWCSLEQSKLCHLYSRDGSEIIRKDVFLCEKCIALREECSKVDYLSMSQEAFFKKIGII